MGFRTDLADQIDKSGPDDDKRYHGKYLGFVRDSFDPEERGRVRIYCPEVMGNLDNEDSWLGWAEADAPLAGFDQGLMMVPPDPSWERRDSGAGNSPYNETRVWVEFRDGDMRRPVYSLGGSWLGESDLPHSKPKLSDSNTGGDETTAAPNRTATTIRRDITDRTTGVTADGPEVQEPQPGTQAQYPFNYVWKSPAGHVVEFDNTPGSERLRVYHPSGSAWEINESGTWVQKIVGKESVFISDDAQRVVKGGATTIVEGLSHHQYNKSSNWVFRSDVIEIVEASKKSFITGGWEVRSGGQYKLNAGNVDIESPGAVKIIAGSAVNIGADDYAVTANSLEVSGVNSKFQGQARNIVKCPTGVELEANIPATNPIYASTSINSSLASIASTLQAATVIAAPALVAPPGVPVPLTNTPALVTWMNLVSSLILSIANTFSGNLTVHRASTT